MRRRQCEARAVICESGQPLPDSSWSAMLAAVHEEVRELPEAERTAFILCDLEGVPQLHAAARLSWRLGTLSGQLCKARKRLLDRLSRRGIVPGVLGIGGLAGSAAVAPADLVAKVLSFPSKRVDGVSPNVAALARGLVEGSIMRTKVLAVALVLAGAMGITGGSMILSQVSAQPPGVTGVVTPSPTVQVPTASLPYRPTGAPTLPSSVGPASPAQEGKQTKPNAADNDKDAEGAKLIIKVHKVSGLTDLAWGDETRAKSLIRVIVKTIEPRSWGEMGGDGSIEYLPAVDSLVIRQTTEIQNQVQDLLVALKKDMNDKR